MTNKSGKPPIEEGPLFGALIIGAGVGYLFYQHSNNLLAAIAIGIAFIILDYDLSKIEI